MSNYSGTKTVRMMDGDLSSFYTNPAEANEFVKCELNQYLIIDTGKELVGPYLWNGETFEEVKYRTFTSRQFGEVKPKNKDPYQMAYMDSLMRNQLTFCTGPAGSGKTLLALGYAFQELEKGHISKIVIFCNPHIATGAVKLGFLPGTRNEKLLESSIGSILISKLGSRLEVESLLDSETLVLMPMGDARGFETPEDSFVYFSEAQNTSRYLMKLFLQRTNDSCKLCVEGDERQVDVDSFENGLNGLARAIEVFRGEDYAGHAQLRNIYRGKIAKKAEEICD